MHGHNHPNKKKIINRMSRAIGHAEAVKRMLAEGKDCSEVLIQIAAVKSAFNNIGKLVLKDHIKHCIVEAVENNDQEVLDKLDEAIEKYIK